MDFINKHKKQWLILIAANFFLISSYVYSEITIPNLTGRVVDIANMLGSSIEQKISDQLANHENATSNQVVVVTLNNLGGYSIEQYGVELGRSWGIGQKDKDNGVLLIVAKKERKVRIEVGYGLEGLLTDAISSNIIHKVIVPQFKKGQFEAGIAQGTTAIIQALGGQYKMNKRHPKTASDDDFKKFIIFFVLFFILWCWLGILSHNRFGNGGYYGGSGGGYGGGGFGGGGFSGGGGGFGGGGASGGW